TAWVSSLSMGMIFFCCPIVSVFTDILGCRKTAVMGAAFGFVGLMSSSFVSSIEPLYLTYGIIFACGCSFAYQPSLVILGHYFKKRLGLVNGIVTAGSSVFTILLPFLLRVLTDSVGLFYTLRVLCIFMFVLFLAAFTYRPLASSAKEKDSGTKGGNRFSLFSRRKFSPPKKIFNFAIFKVTAYAVWAAGIPLALFGYFVPYVHLLAVCRGPPLVSSSVLLPVPFGNQIVPPSSTGSGAALLCCGRASHCPSQCHSQMLQTGQVASLLCAAARSASGRRSVDLNICCNLTAQMKHVNERFQDEKNKEVALMCIGITSGVGRLLFGRIADYVPGVKKVYLQTYPLPAFIGYSSAVVGLWQLSSRPVPLTPVILGLGAAEQGSTGSGCSLLFLFSHMLGFLSKTSTDISPKMLSVTEMRKVLSFFFIGLMSMMIPLCSVFGALIAVCLIMGLFDGCFISIMAPIAFELVGAQDVSQAIGFLLGFISIPMTVGPPVAGLLRDKLGSYDVAFYLAGIPPLIGGAVLCFIPWIHSKKQRELGKSTEGEKMEKMLENQNSLLSSSSGIFKKESDSVI
ncbi:solute carrier family 16, member 10 (aromatic amino acid transporter), partial [Camelus ferus]